MKSNQNLTIVKTNLVRRLGRPAAVAALFASPMLLSSCETTGDPNTGGIFWSERKAQERIDQKQQQLNRIDDQAARAEKSAKTKQREVDRLQQQ